MAPHKWRLVIRDTLLGEPPGWVSPASVQFAGIDNLRTLDYERPLHHGEDGGAPDLLGGSDLLFGLTLVAANDPPTVWKMWDRVIGAWQPAADDLPLLIKTPGGDRLSYGRPRKAIPDLTYLRNGVILVSLLWHAHDPLFYTATPRIVPVTMSPPSGGAPPYPRDWPRGWSDTNTSTTAGLENDGNAEVAPLVQIQAGPDGCGTPTLIDVDSGRLFTLDITIAAGQWIVVDMDRGTVVLTPDLTNDELAVSRSSAVRRPGSDWLTIPPGGAAWKCTCVTGEASVRIISRDAYF